MNILKYLFLTTTLIAQTWAADLNDFLPPPPVDAPPATIIPFEDKIINRLQAAKDENRQVILVLGAQPKERNHFDFSQFGTASVFFLDQGECTSCLSHRPEELRFSSQYEQEGGYIKMNLNDVSQQDCLSRIFSESVDFIVPDTKVCGYLDWSARSVNNYISMLKPGARLIKDSHSRESDLDLLIHENLIDENGMLITGALRTGRVKEFLNGDYYDISKKDLSPSFRVQFSADMDLLDRVYDEGYTLTPEEVILTSNRPLNKELASQVLDAYLIYTEKWFKTHITIPCRVGADNDKVFTPTFYKLRGREYQNDVLIITRCEYPYSELLGVFVEMFQPQL